MGLLNKIFAPPDDYGRIVYWHEGNTIQSGVLLAVHNGCIIVWKKLNKDGELCFINEYFTSWERAVRSKSNV